MPRDESAPIVTPHNVMYPGEVPRTLFLDWLDAVEVKLISGPTKGTIFQGMAEMQQASYSPDLKLARARAREAVKAGTYGDQPLPLNNEIAYFLFLVNGVSRVMTHQIVRTRIGVTYAQKCTGDGDIRHDAALVPRCFNKPGKERRLEGYIDQVLAFKAWYAEAIDDGESIHAARYAMQHSLSQYVYVNISFLALRMLYGKRMCPEQPIEWQAIAGGMKKALAGPYPEFAQHLTPDCERKACHWHKRGNNDPMIGRLYFPDEAHDVAPWNPKSFLHQGDVRDVLGGPRFSARLYHGRERQW